MRAASPGTSMATPTSRAVRPAHAIVAAPGSGRRSAGANAAGVAPAVVGIALLGGSFP